MTQLVILVKMELFLEQVKRIALLDTESPKQYAFYPIDIWNP